VHFKYIEHVGHGFEEKLHIAVALLIFCLNEKGRVAFGGTTYLLYGSKA
jgi:hypothetical protein